MVLSWWATSLWSFGSLTDFSACTAISNSEYTELSACVHWLPVPVAKSSVSGRAVVLSSEDV
jgi:hypothetical protein